MANILNKIPFWIKPPKRWLLVVISAFLLLFILIVCARTEIIDIFSVILGQQKLIFSLKIDHLLKLETLLVIHAGMGALIIALYVAVLQLPSKNRPGDEKAVLLQKTKLHLLTIIEIFVFALTLFPIPVIAIIFGIFFIGIEAICQIVIIYKYYTKESYRKLLYEEFLSNKIDGAIEVAFNDRIKTVDFYKLLKNIEDKYKLNIDYFSPSAEDKYYVLSSQKEGYIENIKEEKLESFIEKVLDRSRHVFQKDTEVTKANEDKADKIHIYFYLRIHDKIKIDEPLVFLSKDGLDISEEDCSYLKNIFNNTFTTVSSHGTSPFDDWLDELGNLKQLGLWNS